MFGGNFLHSYDVPTRMSGYISKYENLTIVLELKIRQIEISTHVPKKFRFPYFTKLVACYLPFIFSHKFFRLSWYVADKCLRDLKTSGSDMPARVLDGILALAEFLVSEARILESGTEAAKKEAKEQIPVDRVKDASAFARELRWRVKQAMGYHSDDESSSSRSKGTTTLAGTKRRRMDDQEDASRFRNFRPKSWDSVVTSVAEDSQSVVKASKPTEDDAEWTHAFTLDDMKNEGEEATVNSRKEIVIKVRRTAQGLERHRIERIVEEWKWDS